MRLLSIDSNSKLAKTNKVAGAGHLYAGLSLMPDNRLCPGAKAAGCMAGCLKSSGRAAIFKAVNEARKAKSDWYHQDPGSFVAQLVKDLEALVRKAAKEGKTARVRLNVLSDIAWEDQAVWRDNGLYEGIPQAFPEIEFYDYTKRAGRIGKVPANYSLTFSYSGVPSYANQVKLAAARGANMAVVFHVKKGQALPKLWQGKSVIDGDLHDARTDDAAGIIVGLRAKGQAIKDTSGFVVSV
jgi:hypothetical protein